MKKILLAIIPLVLLLTGCSNKENLIDDDKFNIVTSFYPMYIATSNVVKGIEDVNLMNMTNTQVGCLHDYQMTTKDMITLEKADVFIVNGGGMESFLDKAISAYPNLDIIVAGEKIFERMSKEDLESEMHIHEEGHNHEQNAHVWVSIDLYIEEVEKIANELSKLDSKNAQKYLQNAKEYTEKLLALRDEMHDILDDVTNKNIITFHEAFEFFADDFNLNIVGVIQREPGTMPSAGELAKIIDTIKETDAKAIFVEPQYERTVADTIAKETGVLVYTLDPVVTGKLKVEAYEEIMRENLKVLEGALK